MQSGIKSFIVFKYIKEFKIGVDRVDEPKHNLDRQIGPELLRIIAMLLIVFHHFALHGGIDYTTFSLNNAYMNVIEFGGKISVNVFIIISGYFSCTSKFSFKKVFKLLFVVEFYSLTLMIVSLFTGAQEFRVMIFVKGFFPLLFDGYWFVTIYIILYVLSPILNTGIDKLRKTHLCLIIVFLLALYCVLPNTIGTLKSISSFEYSMVIWFVTMYLIGGYFRHYGFPLIKHTTLAFLLLTMSLFIMFSARTLQLYLGADFGEKFAKYIQIFAENNPSSIMSLVISILMFCVFLPIKFRGNRMFYNISKATFGVYLIHDNPFFYSFMWKNIIHTKEMYNMPLFIPLSIMSVFLLYTVCTIIEIIRENYIEKPLFSLKVINGFISFLDLKIT